MVKLVTATLGLLVSIALGAGLAGAHDTAPDADVTSEAIDSLHRA